MPPTENEYKDYDLFKMPHHIKSTKGVYKHVYILLVKYGRPLNRLHKLIDCTQVVCMCFLINYFKLYANCRKRLSHSLTAVHRRVGEYCSNLEARSTASRGIFL